MDKINVFLENRKVFKVLGTKCIEFLNNILSSDLKKLNPHEIIPSALLSPQGRVLFDILVSVNVSEANGEYSSINIECDKQQLNELIQKINMYNLRREIEVLTTDYNVIVTNEDNNFSNTFLDKRFSELSIKRIYTENKNLKKNNSNIDVYDFLRFKNCILEGPTEIEPNIALPLEINLDLFGGISFDKGCFIGQEVNARIKWKGLVKKKYVPIRFEYNKQLPLKLEEIRDKRFLFNNTEIGELISLTRNKIKNHFYGIAKIKLSQLYSFEEDPTLQCDFLGSKVEIILPSYMIPLPKKM